MGRSWKSYPTIRENREWPQCHQAGCGEGKQTHTHTLASTTEHWCIHFLCLNFHNVLSKKKIKNPWASLVFVPAWPLHLLVSLCFLPTFLPTLLHFVLHRFSLSRAPFHVPLPLSHAAPPAYRSEGQATCPRTHTHGGGVQERLRRAAPEIQQGTKLLLLLGDTADLQREPRTHTRTHAQCSTNWAELTQLPELCKYQTDPFKIKSSHPSSLHECEYHLYIIFEGGCCVSNRRCRTWMSGGSGGWRRATVSFQTSRRRCCPSSPSV